MQFLQINTIFIEELNETRQIASHTRYILYGIPIPDYYFLLLYKRGFHRIYYLFDVEREQNITKTNEYFSTWAYCQFPNEKRKEGKK